MSKAVLWIILAALYGAVFVWYQGFRDPLSAEEVEAALQRLEARGATAEEVAGLRAFLEDDDGGDFVMVNVIEMRETPLQVEGVRAGESSSDVLARYMAYMWPELLKRACHPVFFGPAVGPALDAWGVEASRRWSQAGLMRYRSRRDLLEISGNEQFRDAHVFKNAAMAKTVAFPVDAFHLPAGPLVTLGLAMFSLGAAVHLLLPRRRPRGLGGVAR